MRTIYFMLAGRVKNNNDTVFFQSKNRQYTTNFTVCHNNDYSAFYRIPIDFFKKHFKYEHSSGIYRTKITYAEILHFSEQWHIPTV